MLVQDSDEEAGVLDSTTLEVERTALTLEHTVMAWVRTATSLISFGFSIYKSFQYLTESGSPPPRAPKPRELGLTMIGVTLVRLLIATVQHWRSSRTLRKMSAAVPRSPPLLLAVGILALGIMALPAVIFRQ